MKNDVLDIWAVQSYKDELYTALSNIKYDDVVVFENLFVNLKINDRLIKNILFNTAIFSEKSDVLILLSNDSPAKREDAIKYLDEAEYNYHLVSFEEHEIKSSDSKRKEFWFARDPYVVSEACDDSLSKNARKHYSFEKFTQAELLFGYIGRDGLMCGCGKTIYFKGKINLEDKIILIVNNGDNIFNKQQQMEKILINKGFSHKNINNLELN